MSNAKPTKWHVTETYATVEDAVAAVLKSVGLPADTKVTVIVDNAPTASDAEWTSKPFEVTDGLEVK